MAIPISSLWTRASELADQRPPLAGDHETEVVVVGGGAAGLSTALRLRERGVDVVVLERHRVGCGVTGGSTAKITALHGILASAIRRHHGSDAVARYVRANQDAVEEIEATVERYGIDCDLTTAAAVNYATTGDGLDLLSRDIAILKAAGVPAQFSDNASGLPFPVRGLVRLGGQAHLHPLRYCAGLAHAIGLENLYEATTVTDVEEDRTSCTVVTEHGSVRAQHAVIATLAPVVDPRFLAPRCLPHRSYALALRLDDGATAPPDMYLGVEPPVRSLRPARLGDGAPGLVVAGEGHPVADESDARACLAALEAWAREHFPVAAVEHAWAAHDQIPSDHLPFVGRLGHHSRRWVATGFQKWGLSTSVVAAAVIADGIVDDEPHPLAGLLDPTRLRSTLGIRLAGDVARVAARYVGDHVATVRAGAEHIAELGTADGVVVRSDAGLTAVHRDTDGALHAVSAVCTHERCLVRFNRAQQSWDCPCHGSRFSVDGEVLCGPAVANLSPVVLPPDPGN